MNLGKQIVNELLEQSESPIKKIIAVYPGRFQPMGKHHAGVYDWLSSKFGKANTYVTTSSKVELPKSPLNFREKVQVIRKHGIMNISEERSPYVPEKLLSKYDPKTILVLSL